MGMLKRIIRQTSSKILSKLGAHRNSHQLVLNHAPVSPTSTKNLSQTRLSCAGRHRKSEKSHRRRERFSKKESTIPEALLQAAKNNLPPVQFHHVHGPNALLSKNKFVARRTQSFCQALVFSNRVILPNERVYIKVLEIAKGWSGTIRFGFTSVDPATLRYQMPRHACPDMTNAGNTWARALADEVVRRNSVIHFSYNSSGYIHYGINNQDCGIFYANVNTRQHLWFIVDIYGLTAAVELIDPRIHNASSEIDISRLDDYDFDLEPAARGTMYKSTSGMDQLFDPSDMRTKKKRSRKNAARQVAMSQWHPENMLMTPDYNTRFDLPAQNVTTSMLPNLNSIILPSAQQNIYTPMPSMLNRPAINEQPHDYYQIMQTNSTHTPRESHSTTRIPRPNQANTSQVSSSSVLDTSLASNSSSSNSDAQEISNQLGEMHISSSISDNAAQQLNSQSKSARTTLNNAGRSVPVAAVRKRLQNNSIQTNSKRTTDSRITNTGVVNQNLPATKVRSSNSSSTQIANSSASSKPKSRQSSKRSPLTCQRDNNNSSPTSKDCPICFERPINCVLYQCGHMCTCYECGVKQWRTQSRTCPICRTVIKDVIKTYMS